jgi:molecular chaperone GrpE
LPAQHSVSLRSFDDGTQFRGTHRGARGQDHGAARDGDGTGRAGTPAERAKNHWEQYLRALADVENVRKRGAKDLESARQFAVEKFAQDLIGVKDSLELGIQNADKADVASLVEGQTATLRLLSKAFEKAQIEEVNPEGSAFNPELHEAMMAQPSDAPPNTVLSVIQRGYTLNGRLLRPARVVVSAAK